jgi:hypothetical protein
MLFQTFIPRTWSRLLKELVSRKLVSDIFNFWPPETSSGELESFCSSLSGQLVDALLKEKAAVWPVYEPQNQSTQFRSLESLIVASPTERRTYFKHLLEWAYPLLGHQDTFSIFSASLGKIRILNPEVAHDLLLVRLSCLYSAALLTNTSRSGKSRQDYPGVRGDQKLLLEYLLSTDNVLNICGLPLIPHCKWQEGGDIQCQGDPLYTMLTRSEFNIFGPCDDLAIPLHQLPPHVEDILLKLGPSSINVQRLSVPRIVEYLSTYPKVVSFGRQDGLQCRSLAIQILGVDGYI